MLEVVTDDEAGTYRALYTVKFTERIYVLHVFQKKSKHGIATTQQDVDLIKRRFKEADEHYRRLIARGEVRDE